MYDIFSFGIGEKFPFPNTNKGENVRLEASPFGMFLLFYYHNPTPKEIFSIKNDALTLFFSYAGAILSCVLQVEDDFWGDAPYFAPMYQKQISTAEMKPAAVYVCLIDADSEILKSFRIIALPPEITAFIYKAQLDQYASGISDAEFGELLDYMRQKFSIKDLAISADAAVIILRDNTEKAFIRKNGKFVQL